MNKMSNRIGTITVNRADLLALSRPQIWTTYFKEIFPRRNKPILYTKSTKNDLIEFLMNYREASGSKSNIRRTLQEKKQKEEETPAQKEKRANLLIINNLLDDFKVIERENITKHINKANNKGLRTIIKKLTNMKERGLTPTLSLNYILKPYTYVEPDTWINQIDVQPVKEEKIKQERKQEEVLLSYKVYTKEVVKREGKFHYKDTDAEYKGKDFIIINDGGRPRYFTASRHVKNREIYTSNSPLLRKALEKKRKYFNNTASWDEFLYDVSYGIHNNRSLEYEPFLHYEWEVFLITDIQFPINVKGEPKKLLLEEPNRDTGNSVLHHNEYMNISINKEATTLEDLFKPNISDYIKQNQTDSSCGLDCIIQTFKDGYDKYYEKKKNKKKLTYDILRTFFSSCRQDKETVASIEMAKIRINKLLEEHDVDDSTKRSIKTNIDDIKLNGLTSIIDRLKDMKQKGVRLSNWKQLKNYKVKREIPNDFKDDSVSIVELERWFSINGKKLRVYTETDTGNIQLFHEFTPSKINEEYHPITCHVVKKDKHLYCLDNKIKSLETLKQCHNSEEEIYVSTNYNYIFKDIESILLPDFYDIKTITFDDYKQDNLVIYTNTDIEAIIHTLRTKCKYDPHILSMKSIIIRFGGKTINLRNHESDFAQKSEEINEYMKYTNELRSIFINKRTISHYPEGWLDIAFNYTPKAINHTIQNIKNNNDLTEFDINKCYAHALSNLKHVPAVNKFDFWRPFTYDMPVYNTYFYLIERNDTTDIPTQYSITYLLEKYNIYTGDILHTIPYEYYKVLAYSPVSIIIPVDNTGTKTLVKTINDSTLLTDKMKKDIPNFLTGNLEKTMNRKDYYKLYTNQETHTKDKKLYPLTHLCKCSGGIMDCSCIRLSYSKIYKEARLEDGFYPIKMLIYMECRKYLFSLVNTLLQNNPAAKPVRILTDALIVQHKGPLKGMDDLINKDIGGLKTKAATQKYFKIRERKPQEIPIVQVQKPQEKITLRNEHLWKTNPDVYKKELIQTLKKHNSIMIQGAVAGAGKTRAAQEYIKAEDPETTIFLCPTNKRVISLMEEGFNAATLCCELGINPFKDTQKGKFLLDKKYKTVIIEEVYAYSTEHMGLIKDLKLKNPHVKFIGTGDKYQNRLDNNRENNYEGDIDAYYDMIVSTIFDTELMLNIGKRYKTEEDEREIREHKETIFNNPKEFILNYPRKITSLSELKHDKYTKFISLKNDTATNLQNHFRGPDILQKDTSVIARNMKMIKIGDVRVYNRMDYQITDFDEKTVKMYDRYTKQYFDFPRKDFYNTFITNICNTSFSTQGDTYRDTTVILFDVHHQHMSSNTLYTTLTRTDTPKNFYIFTGRLPERATQDNRKINENNIRGRTRDRFQQKIENYKKQDREKGRQYEDEQYVDKEWIIKSLEIQDRKCYHCEVDILHNWTVDRKYNELPHTKDNGVLACLNCNVSKLNKKAF